MCKCVGVAGEQCVCVCSTCTCMCGVYSMCVCVCGWIKQWTVAWRNVLTHATHLHIYCYGKCYVKCKTLTSPDELPRSLMEGAALVQLVPGPMSTGHPRV